MSEQLPEDGYHFKQGFDPKCPHCGESDFRISLDEHLTGPANGRYEIIYCGNPKCLAFLGAVPVVIQNLFADLKSDEKINYHDK